MTVSFNSFHVVMITSSRHSTQYIELSSLALLAETVPDNYPLFLQTVHDRLYIYVLFSSQPILPFSAQRKVHTE